MSNTSDSDSKTGGNRENGNKGHKKYLLLQKYDYTHGLDAG